MNGLSTICEVLESQLTFSEDQARRLVEPPKGTMPPEGMMPRKGMISVLERVGGQHGK